MRSLQKRVGVGGLSPPTPETPFLTVSFSTFDVFLKKKLCIGRAGSKEGVRAEQGKSRMNVEICGFKTCHRANYVFMRKMERISG